LPVALCRTVAATDWKQQQQSFSLAVSIFFPSRRFPGSPSHDVTLLNVEFWIWSLKCFRVRWQRCVLEHVTLLNVRVLDYLACPNCGVPKLRQLGKCCCVACRVALHRWRQTQKREAAKARRPLIRIGARSVKPLRSYNTEYHGNILRTVNRQDVM
jgi:hypothetical protein